MTEKSIEELLLVSKEGINLESRIDRETTAVQFWTTYRSRKMSNGRFVTKKKVAYNFNISQKRLGVIIRNPIKIGNEQGHSTRLNEKEEMALVNWITQKAEANMYISNSDIIDHGNVLMKNRDMFGFGEHTKRGPLTKDWFYNFIERHENELGIRKMQALEVKRLKGRDTCRVIEYFALFRDLMTKYNFRFDNIYNCDETPCVIDDIQRRSVWPKSIKQAHIKYTGNRQVLTMFPCVSAAGNKIPPLIIFEGKSIDSSYTDYDFECIACSNDSAYMVKEIFRSWTVHFVKYAKPTLENPVLLIMDNYGGHLDYEALMNLHSNSVYLLGLPPHTSDKTQPLDLTVFAAFKIAYRNILNETRNKFKLEQLHQRDFIYFLKESYKRSFNINTITKGFFDAGLIPFNPVKVLEHCIDWDSSICLDYVPKFDKSEKPLNDLKSILNGSNGTINGIHY